MFETYTPANPVGVPHSREAEEAVLGSILVAPELFSSLGLEKSHFYIQRLGMIWEACSRLDARKSPLDFLTIAEELDDMGTCCCRCGSRSSFPRSRWRGWAPSPLPSGGS